MKETTIGFLLIMILALTGYIFFLQQCKDPPEIIDNSEKIAELSRKTLQLGKEKNILKAERDSLLKYIQDIEPTIVYREREINENIARDSSNSLVEYRRSLQSNNYLPDGTLYLTYREIGLGAILMARVPKLELTVKTYEEVVKKDSKIIRKQDKMITHLEELGEIQEGNIEYYKGLYEDEASFWNSKELWFGVGIAGTIAIVFLAGVAQ